MLHTLVPLTQAWQNQVFTAHRFTASTIPAAAKGTRPRVLHPYKKKRNDKPGSCFVPMATKRQTRHTYVLPGTLQVVLYLVTNITEQCLEPQASAKYCCTTAQECMYCGCPRCMTRHTVQYSAAPQAFCTTEKWARRVSQPSQDRPIILYIYIRRPPLLL